ncbi:alpha/beta fold hydrolase [Haloferula rosea]|uniref:Alpha/beta fold hydrolase n=1 Tax=Haloferula rosea TaxID=490093 RepID=A0A934VHG3_9BACT|nr:alpha/beta fold hydrolase [Haloferula rosea]
MPLVSESDHVAPWWLPGGHLQTIVPSLWRKVSALTRRRERLELADGDFLDLCWHGEGGERLVILSHGLEGSAEAAYIQGMGRALAADGWDVLAWNYRGCSGEMNRLPRFYHSGATCDLAAVVEHALEVHPAKTVDLIGFSLGGNLTLKYLGELGEDGSPRLGRAVAFSVPCDLACSSRTLTTAFNREVYMRRFIVSLAEKVRAKAEMFPDELDPSRLEGVKTFREFDDRFTAPLHGFEDAADYWARSSSRPFLPQIRIPALLVNAANDPFLGPGCYPRDEARDSDWFHLEVPRGGGHVGFGGLGPNWAEKRAVRFLKGEG